VSESCACLSPEQTLLARYFAYLLTEFDQTFTTNGLCGKDECVRFWGQKVGGGIIVDRSCNDHLVDNIFLIL